MSYQTINLKAGVPYLAGIAGRLILLDNIGASDGVDVRVLRQGTPDTVIPKRKAAFRMVAPYDDVEFKTSVDTAIGVFLSTVDVEIGYVDRAAVTIPDGVRVNSTVGDPVHVALDRDITLGVVQVENNLTVIVDAAPVAVGEVATIVSNDPALKKLRMKNVSNLAMIMIGGPGVALGSPIVLNPGDTYFEDDAAGATLYAIANMPGALLQLQGLKKP